MKVDVQNTCSKTLISKWTVLVPVLLLDRKVESTLTFKKRGKVHLLSSSSQRKSECTYNSGRVSSHRPNRRMIESFMSRRAEGRSWLFHLFPPYKSVLVVPHVSLPHSSYANSP